MSVLYFAAWNTHYTRCAAAVGAEEELRRRETPVSFLTSLQRKVKKREHKSGRQGSGQVAVPGVPEDPARASRGDAKRRWLQQLGCEEGQGKAAATRGRTARVRARPRPGDASRRSEPRSSVKVGLIKGVLVHREDGPSPAPAYLPSLTSGAWPSSVTTCGRGGRRCRSPFASLIPQVYQGLRRLRPH